MKIILQDNKRLMITKLPKEIDGNCWLTGYNKKNLVNIEAIDGKWVLKNNFDIKILSVGESTDDVSLFDSNKTTSVVLEPFSSGILYDINQGIEYKYYCLPYYDDKLFQIEINKLTLTSITIGRGDNNTIKVNIPTIANNQIEIVCDQSKLKITNLDLNNPMFINNKLTISKELLPGELVFINGFHICLYGNVLVFNNPNNSVSFNEIILKRRNIPTNPDHDYTKEPDLNIELYKKDDYFQRPPRFQRVIEPQKYVIDPPPQKQSNENEMPMILTVGPMLGMGLMAVYNGLNAVLKVRSGAAQLKDSIQPILMSGVMLMGMIVFPLIQKFYVKNRKKKREKKRHRRYREYIKEKTEMVKKELELQRQILIENFLPLEKVMNVVLKKERTLWERKYDHYDFLTARLGFGKMESFVTLEFPEEHFELEPDDLRKVGDELVESSKYLENVPITLNLVKSRFSSFVGNKDYLRKFFEGVLLQFLTYHSYDILNIVVLANDEDSLYWKKFNSIPHFWNTSKSIRFIGTNSEEIAYISNYLLKVYQSRQNSFADSENKNTNENPYPRFMPYYLIVTDSIETAKKSSIINELLHQPLNYGFSLVILSESLDNLPNEINTFVNIDPRVSTLFYNTLVSTNQTEFLPDIVNKDLSECYLKLCNIPIDIAEGKYSLPQKYAFLEMYDVGNVNQLNITNRWKESNVTQTLAAPVGVNEDGELFKIDLHEKAHGPHGLVAGMTGSGKSEWIVTYILSMCINYHPDEVQFVLIDYKGGGLAGTFENKETGFKLPHLAGTITNLDITEINRSLASINSELKRRQSLFNQARDKLGESSIDIYKYQRLYREGKIEEPISHLFIISDEFAELKAQQPEFMAQLISTARIGRSLGVHLILATQKPSGVVDDQIWSNSKFRVCLKVQEKADSKDMILVPDAALLKEPGRFYLQVGYNEFFAKGQSAYAGSPYYESDKHKTTIDSSLCFVDGVGEPYKEINTKKNIEDAVYKGEELPFILEAINDAAIKNNINVKQLWLDAIPAKIYLNDLKQKYEYSKENFILNPIIGEYDVPARQSQYLLTLPLSKKGNTIIYGAAGSGKEDTLTTIVYSLMTTYVAQEVNLYMIDCGSESLNNFRKSPIVGDVMLSSDEEKVNNLFKKLIQELDDRKKLFMDYNADYYLYCKNSGTTVPNIVVIINNFEAFQELFTMQIDNLTQLTRDGEKYGIFFITTLSSNTGMRMKLSQNFKYSIVLQMTDPYSYRGILGSGSKIVPSPIKGRGLVKFDDIYEIQVASIAEEEKLVETIKEMSETLSSKAQSFASKIPILPDVVDLEFLSDEKPLIDSMPIGVYTDNLNIAKFNFVSDDITLVLSEDETLLTNFSSSLIKYINTKNKDLRLVIFNSYEIKNEFDQNVVYVDKNFASGLSTFEKYLDTDKKNRNTLIIFNGFDKIYTGLDTNERKIVESICKKVRDKKNYDVVFVDVADSIKKNSFESWFKNYVNTSNGIWLGNNIAAQSVFKITRNTKEMRDVIPENMGYRLFKGIPSRIKYIEFNKKDVK